MPSVDDRVVAMKFDNNAFENKVASTISSLGKLKNSLNFEGQAKGLQDLSTSSSKFNLDGITRAVEHVSGKFSAMGVVAFTTLQGITNAALMTGKQVVSALTLDPVMDGFREYEQNMNAIQTVLSNTRSKGTTLDDVNVALTKLNEYSDKTIYNFGQMAKNIGTFTAAGVNLETSVASIKGISNLAAISGSNAEQASSAMYQLSQALASGTVKLIDWNSIVNAGMGGEVFQKALFETGKSLGTIKNANLGTTFEQWTKAGGSFREQLESGWLTSKVLTNTLQGFTGDLNEAQLIGLGYTKAQAKEFLALGASGLAAATDVKTLTQLLSTIKESLGSGWSESFKLMVGDFGEAKALFTSLNGVASGFIQKSADSRNELLKGFRELGGRDKVIDALRAGMFALAAVMGTVGKAFRNVFPKQTASSLAQLAENLRAFMHQLIPSEDTLYKIGNIFRGVFSVLSIGWTVIKQVAGAFKVLFSSFKEANGSGILTYFSDLGTKIFKLHKTLVAGGGIAEFFEEYINPIARFIGNLDFNGAIQTIIDGLTWLKETIAKLFGGASTAGADAMAASTDRLAERWGWLIDVGRKLGDFFAWIGRGTETVVKAFQGLFDKIGEGLKQGDYSKVYDALNTGIFAGIALIVTKFFKDGFKFDFGENLLKNVSNSFRELTGTLSAMQTSLKADALFKIAGAIALLTASVLVLSLIDSAALTKAMIAIGVGFGELVGTMELLDRAIEGPLAASKLAIASVGIIALAGAMVILSLAVKVMSTMSPEELARGLAGIGVMLAEVTLAANLIDAKGMISAGLGIVGMSIALLVLSGVLKVLATISPEDLAKGLATVGVALLELTLAMNLMPDGGKMVLQGLGLIAVSIALGILAGVIFAIGSMDLKTMTQGLAGVAGALLVLTVAIDLMPASLPLIGAGLILVAIGLLAMTASIAILGSMDLGTMVQGLGGIAVALGVLAIAMHAMNGAIIGAFAMIVAAGALLILAAAIKVMEAIPFSAVMLSLLGFAIVIAAIALGSVLLAKATPFILALGAALLVLGLGLAAIGLAAILFGAAIYLIAAAIKLLVEVGTTGIESFIEVLPELTIAVAKAIIGAIQEFLNGTPAMIEAFGKILGAILDLLEEYSPRANATMLKLITDFCNTVINASPQIIAAGFHLMMTFLGALDANIGKITETVANIITKFLNELSLKIQPLIDAGTAFLVNFLNGIGNNIQKVVDAATYVLLEFLKGVNNNIGMVIKAGSDIIISLIKGLSDHLVQVTNAAGDLIVAFLKGLSDNITKVVNAGFQFLIDFLNGLSDAIDNNAPKIREAALKLVRSIINGIVGGLGDLGGMAIEGIKKLAGDMLNGIKGIFGISSPSKEMYNIAGNIALGFVRGFKSDTSAVKSAELFASDMVSSINNTLIHVASVMDNMNEFSPTITPVLDLTNVEQGAKRMGSIMGQPKIDTNVSFDQAAAVSVATKQEQTSSSESETPISNEPIVSEVNFNQTINAPVALSTADIYRNTKSQISLAKEELK